MANMIIRELTPDDVKEWKKAKKAEEEAFSDEAWKEYLKKNNVKICSCGSPYSFKKDDKDPGACQECRGEIGEWSLKY